MQQAAWQINRKKFKCFEARQAFFVQFLDYHILKTQAAYSVFVAHLFYISPRDIVFLLNCSPALRANLKTTWSQTVELIRSDSPPVPSVLGHGIGVSAWRIKPKCHSPWLCKMTLSLHVLWWITVGPLPELSMLFEACAACLWFRICERGKGRGRREKGGEGMGWRQKSEQAAHCVNKRLVFFLFLATTLHTVTLLLED